MYLTVVLISYTITNKSLFVLSAKKCREEATKNKLCHQNIYIWVSYDQWWSPWYHSLQSTGILQSKNDQTSSGPPVPPKNMFASLQAGLWCFHYHEPSDWVGDVQWLATINKWPGDGSCGKPNVTNHPQVVTINGWYSSHPQMVGLKCFMIGFAT